MSDVKRRAVIASVFLFVMGVSLIGVTGFTRPDAKDWSSEGELLFANGREGSTSSEDTVDPGDLSIKAPRLPAPVEADEAQARSSNSPDSSKKEDEAGDSFSPVEKDEWVYKAVEDLAKDELPSLEEGLDRDKAVTRYELAVILARVMEKLQGAGKVIEGPLAKVAMLEKLSKEFEQELDILGVAKREFAARLDALEGRVDEVESKTAGLEEKCKEVAKESQKAVELSQRASNESEDAREKAESSQKSVGEMLDKLTSYDEKLGDNKQRLKKLSEIMSRLLVKVALNDSRIKDIDPSEAKRERRDIGALARAVQGLQKKVVGLEESSDTHLQRVDTLSRTIERVSRNVVAAKGGRRGVSPKALAEVKGLLKGFLGRYERRLQRVEKKMM